MINMDQLPTTEKILFVSAMVIYVIAAAACIRHLRRGGEKYRYLLISLVALAVCLEAVLLIFRAIAIDAFPLNDLFDSMIVFTIAFGLAYLFLSVAIDQVWFNSVMVWVLLALTLLAGKVAGPVPEFVEHAAQTPWAIAHGLAMVFGGVMVAFSTASAYMYLLGNNRLKNKQIGKVVGRLPNIEKLAKMNLFGLKAGFGFITFGIISGFVLTLVIKMRGGPTIAKWLVDPKIVLMLVAWFMLACVLVLRGAIRLKGRAVAYITMVTFFFIIFAIVGVTFFCGTQHVFT